MEWVRGEYSISTDPARLSLAVIHRFLSASYWAEGRSVEKVQKSIENSLCFGVYHGNDQVGLARVVTDWATVYYLCDVFILDPARGQGLGKWLVRCVVNYPGLQGLRGLLATQDAHGLYEQFGFQVHPDPRRFMSRPADAAPLTADEEGAGAA